MPRHTSTFLIKVSRFYAFSCFRQRLLQTCYLLPRLLLKLSPQKKKSCLFSIPSRLLTKCNTSLLFLLLYTMVVLTTKVTFQPFVSLSQACDFPETVTFHQSEFEYISLYFCFKLAVIFTEELSRTKDETTSRISKKSFKYMLTLKIKNDAQGSYLFLEHNTSNRL